MSAIDVGKIMLNHTLIKTKPFLRLESKQSAFKFQKRPMVSIKVDVQSRALHGVGEGSSGDGGLEGLIGSGFGGISHGVDRSARDWRQKGALVFDCDSCVGTV